MMGGWRVTAFLLAVPAAQAQTATCDLASMQTMLAGVTTGCCTNPGQEMNCPAGQAAPNVCDATCAESFEPYWDACGSSYSAQPVSVSCISLKQKLGAWGRYAADDGVPGGRGVR